MGLLIGVGNTVPKFPYQELWYGIRINLKNGGHNVADGKVERVGNLDLHRSLPIQKRIRRYVAREDGTVNYWLGANDSTLKEGGGAAKLNAVDGIVQLYKPDYYRKFEFDGDYLLVAISEVALPGFTRMKEKSRSPWLATFNRTNNKPTCASFLQWESNGSVKRVAETGLLDLLPNATDYRGGTNVTGNDGKPTSVLGMPATSTNKATIRTRCKSLGDNWHCGGWRFREEMSWLMAIEFGELDSQAPYNAQKTEDGFAQGGLGNGSYVGSEWGGFNGWQPFIPAGITAKLGNNTGVVDYLIKEWKSGVDKTIKVASYRGWEQPQQYLWEHNDDVLVFYTPFADGGACKLYLCSNPAKFTTPSDHAGENVDGYQELGLLPAGSGYISEMGVANGYSFPSNVTGGAANKNYCDYFWRQTVNATNNADGWYQLLSSATATYSENSGVRCAYANARGASTNTDWGFPLCLEFPSSEGI